nr:brain-enriched guanylate kinase-associated protein isoform X2 [Microcebus murinus]
MHSRLRGGTEGLGHGPADSGSRLTPALWGRESGAPASCAVGGRGRRRARHTGTPPRPPLSPGSGVTTPPSTTQEQKVDLRKRLTYTTHKLEKLENDFDSTRHYLEVELRRAQEELEKVTEKLLGIQGSYTSLQRVNQELEEKVYLMRKRHEEEKRALNHEIMTLKDHLLEAKITIQKLSEENERYRKDCNLAAQLLQCSQNYGKVFKVSELPLDFQERVNRHLEQHSCGLPSQLCYADTVPACIVAKVLEKPDPCGLSDAPAGGLPCPAEAGKPAPRPLYKEDLYCSDAALYCPEERREDRRPSVDASVSEAGYLPAQNSTDSAADEEEPEREAAAYPESYRHEAFASGYAASCGYAASLPTSSSYSSFSAASEEKEHAQTSMLTASQQAVYLNNRDELFRRKPPTIVYECSTRFGQPPAPVVPPAPPAHPVPPMVPMPPLQAGMPAHFGRTYAPYAGDTFRFPAPVDNHPPLAPPNLWSLRAKAVTTRFPGDDLRGQWRAPSVEDIGAYSYPARNASRMVPGSFEHYYGGGGVSPGKVESSASPLYASYKADSFSEGDDLSQGHLADPCFLRACGELSLSPSRSDDPLPSYAPSEGDGDRLGVQLCGEGSSPEPDHGSRDSLERSSADASPEMHPAACLSPQQAFPRNGGPGLSRKDSLTKAQLYGTLLN